jgi:hypothetical protein
VPEKVSVNREINKRGKSDEMLTSPPIGIRADFYVTQARAKPKVRISREKGEKKKRRHEKGTK